MGREAEARQIEAAKLDIVMKQTMPKIQAEIEKICADTRTRLYAQIMLVGRPMIQLSKLAASKPTLLERLHLKDRAKRDNEYLQSIWLILQTVWQKYDVVVYAEITPNGAEMKVNFKNPTEAIKKYEQEHTKVWTPPNAGEIKVPKTVG
ncbi:MAG: hypothetical protein QME51_10965 [Planctomycetota bacterium]|nr:hypothetical protein [Planctomycetota bacterium]